MAKTKKTLPTMNEVINMGLEDGKELLEKLDQDCIKLEKDPQNIKLINEVFRSVHSLKATTGFMMATGAISLLQTLEKLLDKVREGKITVNTSIMTVTFNTIDAVRKIFSNIEKTKLENFDVLPLLQNINDILDNKISTMDSPKDPPSHDNINKIDHTTILDNEDIELITSIRIDSKKLDTVMNLVGELIIGRNQLDSLSTELKSLKFKSLAVFMDRIIAQLQTEVVSLRMIAIERVFSKLPKLARDISSRLNKSIEVIIRGEKTILDKSILDNLYDPLVHLVRNAIDHGIESSNVRVEKNKPEKGIIKIIARQEQDTVVIEVEDDGCGLDSQKLKEIAIRKNLITQNDADILDVQDCYNLIFLPGFSILQKATEISGRGVGLDVVKTNLARLNGLVEVSSKKDKGTKFTLKVPLTIIIQTSIEVKISTEIYAVPLGSVQEVFAVNRKDIQSVAGKQTVAYHGSRLPIVNLENAFNLIPTPESQNRLIDQIMVLKAADEKIGIVVDEILGREEIVIKPLGEYLGEIQGLAGATVLGSGKVILILDIFSLIKLTKKYQQNSSNNFHLNQKIATEHFQQAR